MSKAEEAAYLVLGCHGRIEDGFVLCQSTENRILKLNEALVNFEGIVDYLEGVQLFDRPMLDYNALRHLVHNLQDRFDQKVRRLWTERYYNLIERHIVMHRPCGLYARLVLVNEEDKQLPQQEEFILIQGLRKPPEAKKEPQLKLVRGRR